MEENLEGMKFGHLVVLSRSDDVIAKNGMVLPTWKCQCDCGNIVIKHQRVLIRGYGLSCGCFSDQDCPSHEKLYNVWISMKQRCYNKNDKGYKNYGGRGISVCEEWESDYLAFKEWAYKNGYTQENSFHLCTIDRIDVNGNYCPSNCRIVSRKIQNDNTTRTVYITHCGETHTIKEWSKITGINAHTIYTRIYDSHWEPEKAITIPVNTKCWNKSRRKSNGIHA